MTRTPLPCGCIPGVELCNRGRDLWWAAFAAAEEHKAAPDGLLKEVAWRKYKAALAAYDAHTEQKREAA
ncbi:MAG: hypothetical protein PVJ86_03980 [Phycisphaerales bacterium]|jgi:hypothetical protein